MNEYIIFTDSGCDLSPEVLNRWNVRCRSLTFAFDGESTQYANDEMSSAEFYSQMRSGKQACTSAINPDTFLSAFEDELKQGRDVLYLGFSSALSTTYNSACIAAQELRETYPDRKILTVDTLSASAGQGLLVYLTVLQQKGASIEEAAQFAECARDRICHWFTVDTLTYLKRGGRVSAAAATLGNMLDLRPILYVSPEGKLESVSKVRGRKASIKALADKVAACAVADSPVFISHADALEDAKQLAKLIEDKTGLVTQIITDVGPVIGAHAGPGTLALFFVGEHR